MTAMRLWIAALSLFAAAGAHGIVAHIPIKSRLALRPGEAYTVSIDATEPMEIGWKTVQAKPCTTNCVQATQVSTGITYSIATPLGAAKKYTPEASKISIEYKNVSSEPVTIDVYRVERTCDAEGCRFLDEGQKSRWLVFKVDEFKTIATSKDESYSVISGVAMSGRPFRFRAVWWTDERPPFMVNCAPSVKRYLENRAPKEQYRPYVISGQAIGAGDNIVLKSVDTCAPKAPKFGVPEENVFR